MKLLSIAVPCYNSAEYMEKCIKTLLVGGEEVEILLVDDGSTKDNTAKIADHWAKKYPTIIRAIHQENAGHGGAVNTGLLNATGLYFKVVDSDDRLQKKAYLRILEVIRKQVRSNNPVDMILSNFVYDKQGVKHKKIMQYRRYLPIDQVFTWDDIRKFPLGKYILMHSIMYRTQLIKDCQLKLPKHTFYVDNIFAFYPFPYVKTMYYVDVNFYWYFIGRDDQSVNEKVMISRIDQQMRVNRLMMQYYVKFKEEGLLESVSKNFNKYMLSDLTIITAISSIMCIRSNDPKLFEMKKELWNDLKTLDKEVYKKIRYSALGIGLNLPGKGGREIASKLYEVAQRIYGFN
ncbi:Glycosyltransferase [Lachnospiraceae bacterium TWA4]|nr:Glycosyltransferase [Lachnospiraceae bacterium TWA4]